MPRMAMNWLQNMHASRLGANGNRILDSAVDCISAPGRKNGTGFRCRPGSVAAEARNGFQKLPDMVALGMALARGMQPVPQVA